MPKISAPTVAEHHARTRAALLTAATELLVEQGAGSVTPAAVGARAGLARSSVYQYFASTGALLAGVVEDAFPPATLKLQEAVAAATTPEAAVDAYVHTALELAESGAHRPVQALSGVQLPKECLTRLRELHHEQAKPLRDSLEQLGVPNVDLATRLISGALVAGMAAVDDHQPVDVVSESLLAMVHAISLQHAPSATSR